MTPKETDMALSALWRELYAIWQRIDYNTSDLLRIAGAKYYYRGRQRVTDMKLADAIEIATATASAVAEYKATHQVTESDGWVRTDWDEWKGRVAPYEADRPGEALAKREALLAERFEKQAEIDKLEATYTGWSRFFLVTSSAGHVHSSMHCSTCYPTTTYGWMPELSGKTEAEAVDELGPTLCTVCFPSAPVDWTAGKKLTRAQAEKRAA
jgi:hypothetical protein